MALQVEIKKRFQDFVLDVSFETDVSCMGILGASGCGKSMTLKCIAGIEKPDSGRIVLNGRVLFDSKQRINLPPQERRVGYLFQNYALFPTMTVEQNLAIVMGKGKKDRSQEIQEQLARFHLSGLEGRIPSQLSGGQQQRVALARMLLYHPEIILLDEPFSALDGFLKDTLQFEMMEVIREYSGDVILVSHSRDEVFKLCVDTMVMSEGKAAVVGKTKDIFSRPRCMEAARLTGCKNISAIRRINDYELYATDWGIRLHTGEKIEADIRYAGIRAHNLVPLQEDPGENTMRVTETGYAETPFTRQYLFRSADGKGTADLWWLKDRPAIGESSQIKKTEAFPLYIQFPKESILLLH